MDVHLSAEGGQGVPAVGGDVLLDGIDEREVAASDDLVGEVGVKLLAEGVLGEAAVEKVGAHRLVANLLKEGQDEGGGDELLGGMADLLLLLLIAEGGLVEFVGGGAVIEPGGEGSGEEGGLG